MFDSVIIFLCNVLCALFCLLCVRIFIVLLRIRSKRASKCILKNSYIKTMIIMGSGGHTYEMLRMIQNVNKKFYPRIYIIAETDKLSQKKVKSFEDSKSTLMHEEVIIERIPRSREVGQSWISTIFTTMSSCFSSLFIMWKHQPDLLICNGPGTCVPLCLAALFLQVLGVKRIRTIYVESICRVQTMSLTGKILHNIVDGFLVQWPQLTQQYRRAKYIGKLI